jgi:hypothetical protein
LAVCRSEDGWVNKKKGRAIPDPTIRGQRLALQHAYRWLSIEDRLQAWRHPKHSIKKGLAMTANP